MREIRVEKVAETVARLCQEANFGLGEDVLAALRRARDREESPLGRQVLEQLLENARIAREGSVPICQDCGVAVVFLEIGQDVHFVGGNLYEAVRTGVADGYALGYLRKSVVRQPFSARVNTGDNVPPVIYTDIVAGDRAKVTVMVKGGGSENMSRLAMLTPSQGREGVVESVVRAVDEAGSNPCPPLIVGVGIGGTADAAMVLAKKALLRKVGEPHADPEVASLEAEALDKINAIGIGPSGLGGRMTALAVHVEVFPTHIASLPVAVNLQCHAARHQEAVL
jgi:fumarate hydratase subunit alpha